MTVPGMVAMPAAASGLCLSRPWHTAACSAGSCAIARSGHRQNLRPWNLYPV